MLKYWKKLRGWKRQAGALVMFLAIFLPICGVNIPDDAIKAIEFIGSIIFGVGWLDKGVVELEKKKSKK